LIPELLSSMLCRSRRPSS